jgi:hypothetical protein
MCFDLAKAREAVAWIMIIMIMIMMIVVEGTGRHRSTDNMPAAATTWLQSYDSLPRSRACCLLASACLPRASSGLKARRKPEERWETSISHTVCIPSPCPVKILFHLPQQTQSLYRHTLGYNMETALGLAGLSQARPSLPIPTASHSLRPEGSHSSRIWTTSSDLWSPRKRTEERREKWPCGVNSRTVLPNHCTTGQRPKPWESGQRQCRQDHSCKLPESSTTACSL